VVDALRVRLERIRDTRQQGELPQVALLSISAITSIIVFFSALAIQWKRVRKLTPPK
jgi:hypothetical protein